MAPYPLSLYYCHSWKNTQKRRGLQPKNKHEFLKHILSCSSGHSKRGAHSFHRHAEAPGEGGEVSQSWLWAVTTEGMSLSCMPAVFTAERRATLPTQPHSEETMKWPLNHLLYLLRVLSSWNDSQGESHRGWAKWPEVLRKPEFSVGHLLQAPASSPSSYIYMGCQDKKCGWAD